MSNPEKPIALIVSPHQDDAALSLGAYATDTYKDVQVLNVFTQSTAHMLDGVPDDVATVSKIRHDEDAAVANKYGFTFTDAGFLDAEERGVAWNDSFAPVDAELLDQVTGEIASFLRPYDASKADVYLPAAFGLHPDHYIALQAGLRAMGGRSLRMYADQPYYFEPHAVRHGALDRLTLKSAINPAFDPSDKKAMLSLYPSQLTPGRVRRLSNVGSEYMWELQPNEVEELSVAAGERRRFHSVLFGRPAWLSATESAYANDARRPMTALVENAQGETVHAPIMLDTQQVEGVGSVTFARHLGVYGSDYMDFEGMRAFDDRAAAHLRRIAKKEGAQYLWLSGMRERDGYASMLSYTAEGRHETFEGISSYQTTCHPDGFASWIDSGVSAQRKKMRQIARKIDALEQGVGSVEFQLNKGTTDGLNDFLQLQKERAEATGMDAFAMDDEYRQFLGDVVEAGLVSFADVIAGDNKVSTLLVLDDKPNRSLAILAQGFDMEWSYYSPSYIAMYKLIEHAHEKGYRSVDFLRGDEYYKHYFIDSSESLYKHIEALGDVSDQEWENVTTYVKAYEE